MKNIKFTVLTIVVASLAIGCGQESSEAPELTGPVATVAPADLVLTGGKIATADRALGSVPLLRFFRLRLCERSNLLMCCLGQ
jgi:hypothetical protein